VSTVCKEFANYKDIHHVKFLSGVIPVYGGGWNSLLSVQMPLLRLVFKSTFFKFSLTFSLHMLFGVLSFTEPQSPILFSVRCFLLPLEHAQTIAMHSPSPSFHQRSQAKQIHQVFGVFSASHHTWLSTGALKGGPGGTSSIEPGVFRGAQNFRNSARYIYTKMKKIKKWIDLAFLLLFYIIIY